MLPATIGIRPPCDYLKKQEGTTIVKQDLRKLRDRRRPSPMESRTDDEGGPSLWRAINTTQDRGIIESRSKEIARRVAKLSCSSSGASKGERKDEGDRSTKTRDAAAGRFWRIRRMSDGKRGWEEPMDLTGCYRALLAKRASVI